MQKAFQRLGGRTLIAWDGTEYFNSYKIGCSQCLTRSIAARYRTTRCLSARSNGKTENYHTMLSATVVAPGHAKVVPLMPEFIAKQDGHEKQDCERVAVKRWFEKHSNCVKSLRPVYLGDDLFGCNPVAQMVTENGGDSIFTCKETSHKALMDFIEGATCEVREDKVRKGRVTETFRYKWIEDVPLRDGEDAIKVILSGALPHGAA
jgi:hypothetical protein